MFTFHHSESTASLASSAGGDDGDNDCDSGIKLPPEAELFPAEVLLLRPTQLAVGMQQVRVKMAKVAKKQAKGAEALDTFLRKNPIPVVIGPGQSLYLIDHHHLARALYESGVKTCYAGAARDLSSLEVDEFWRQMAAAKCLWPYCREGKRVEEEELPGLLPNTVAELQDDPYRSLAALVRKAGGYQKSTKPFSEFMWANYLRPRIPLALETPDDVVHFVGRGISHATAPDAAVLPGHTPLSSLNEGQMDLMADLGGLGPGDDDDGEGGKGGKAKGDKKGDKKEKDGKGKGSKERAEATAPGQGPGEAEAEAGAGAGAEEGASG